MESKEIIHPWKRVCIAHREGIQIPILDAEAKLTIGLRYESHGAGPLGHGGFDYVLRQHPANLTAFGITSPMTSPVRLSIDYIRAGR